MWSFESTMKEHVWPAVPRMKAGLAQAFLFQIELDQWLPADEIERRQLEQVRRLLLYAHKTVPFYTKRLGPFVGRLRREALTAELFREIPPLTRQDMRRVGEKLRSTALPQSHGKAARAVTSGSSGEPVAVWFSELFYILWDAIGVRQHLWRRRDLGGKLAMIRGRAKGSYPEGARVDNWGTPGAADIATGPLVSLDITTPPELQLEWLLREDPDYFITYPTNLDRLVRLSMAQGARPARLREVMSVAEILTPSTRRLVREAWGLPIYDAYTSSDAGYMALQCPETEHYHVQSEVCRLEVVDESGRPCAPGETGRVLVTPIHGFAMPTIRYELGDRAVAGVPCTCGRGLPVIESILGRTHHMVVHPSGERRLPLISGEKIDVLMSEYAVAQFQFAQVAIDRLEARLVCDRPLGAAEEAAVKAWMQDAFKHPFEVDLVYLDRIPRTEAGKYFEFLSELEA